ncbi:MAG: twin-arginine translocase TatA/TatE family subunit [Bacteroidales bacterium]|nr:twin-arginine translocase TatA/TatE family subunit [Bacteroidales bacterium]
MDMILLGMFGGPEIIIIAVVILLLFGGKKLPELMKGLGKGIRDFKDATSGNDMKKEFDDVKKEVRNAGEGMSKANDAAKSLGKPLRKK